MKNKGVVFGKLFFLFYIFLICFGSVSSLSVTPAAASFNFQPNFEYTFNYHVGNVGEERVVGVSVVGDLAEYAELDKNKLVGGGDFNLHLKLPPYIEVPGMHRILVSVKEIVSDDEFVGSTIGTSVEIRAVVDVYVPYPGRYLEMELTTGDVNFQEPVKFEIDLTNRGVENLTFSPIIEIYNNASQGYIETLYFQERNLSSGENIKLQKFLNTTDYSAGAYNALAIVNYGSVAQDSVEFRIGRLFIELTNYTKEILLEGLQRFDIEVASSWNDRIDGAYAEVSVLNDSEEMTNFKTTSASLNPWESKILTGYFDTSNFTEGTYDANVTLYYYGKTTGKSSSEIVEIEFVKPAEVPYLLIGLIVVGIIVLIGVFFILKKYFFKHGKK